MSKILVTGANGFVGKHVIAELQKLGHSVVGVGGPATASSENTITLDLTKAEEANNINFADIGGVIHLAGLAAVGPSFEQPELYMRVNVSIQVNLFEAALSQNSKARFIVVSTGALYDPKADLPLTEASPVLASSPYAASKLEQENKARVYGERGLEIVIARPFNHIGPGQSPGFIVPDLAQQLVAYQQASAPEVLVGNLDAKRDYTDVRDIARAYCLLLEKGTAGETYNICSGQPLSGHDILDGLLKISGSTPTIKQDPTRLRPSDNPLIYGSHTKLTKDTGWQPEIAIETTLADALADWRGRSGSVLK